MSIKRMTAVWDESQHSGNALLLLLAIADFADDNGLAWPGHERLATKTRVNRRTIVRLVDETAASGDLWAMNRDRQQSNIYIVTPGLTVDKLVAGIRRARDMGVTSTRGRDILSIPPQVLVVVTKCPYQEAEKVAGRDIMTLGRDIDVHTLVTSVSLDPSLSVITRQGEDIWQIVLSELKLQMTDATFGQWFTGSHVADSDNGVWTIKLKHQNAVEWVGNRLRPMVERTVERHAPGTEIRFVA